MMLKEIGIEHITPSAKAKQAKIPQIDEEPRPKGTGFFVLWLNSILGLIPKERPEAPLRSKLLGIKPISTNKMPSNFCQYLLNFGRCFPVLADKGIVQYAA